MSKRLTEEEIEAQNAGLSFAATHDYVKKRLEAKGAKEWDKYELNAYIDFELPHDQYRALHGEELEHKVEHLMKCWAVEKHEGTMKATPITKEDQKRLIIEMMEADEKDGLYEDEKQAQTNKSECCGQWNEKGECDCSVSARDTVLQDPFKPNSAPKGGGLRFNSGKIRYDLMHPVATKGIANVLTKGAEKYTLEYENRWEKLLLASGASKISVNIAKECVAVVTRDNSGKITLSTQSDKGLIAGDGGRNTQKEKENWILLDEQIQKKENEIRQLKGSCTSGNTVWEKSYTNGCVSKAVSSAGEKNICTLTTIIQQENSEASYVASATTVSDSLEMMQKVLQEHLNISFKQSLKNDGYGNWEKGMKWSNVLASMKRHIAAFESGEDYDPETGLLHIDHVQCNAHFLSAYYKIYPQGDDRRHGYLENVKIGLDIDEVLCDWVGDWCNLRGVERPSSWYFDRELVEKFEEMKAENKLDEFYLSLQPLVKPEDIPFEPHCYITSRPVDTKVTEQWLAKHGFPARPVFTADRKSKVEIAKEQKLDVFVDDNWNTFAEMNKAGITCYLMDAKHNRRYEAGYKRIKNLKELV